MSIKVTDAAGNDITGMPSIHGNTSVIDFMTKITKDAQTFSAEDSEEFKKGAEVNKVISTAMNSGVSMGDAFALAMKQFPEFETELDLIGFLISTGYLRPVPDAPQVTENTNGLFEVAIKFESFKEK